MLLRISLYNNICSNIKFRKNDKFIKKQKYCSKNLPKNSNTDNNKHNNILLLERINVLEETILKNKEYNDKYSKDKDSYHKIVRESLSWITFIVLIIIFFTFSDILDAVQRKLKNL